VKRWIGDVKFMAGIGAFSRLASHGVFGCGQFVSRRDSRRHPDLLKRHQRPTPIPFGPLHRAGGSTMIFAGKPLVNWFLETEVLGGP